jgi:sodium--glutamate symport carrier gltS
MILYAYFVTFRVMGKNYDASVLAAVTEYLINSLKINKK